MTMLNEIKVQDEYRDIIEEIIECDDKIADYCYQLIRLEKQYPNLNLAEISNKSLLNVSLDDFRDLEEVFSNR